MFYAKTGTTLAGIVCVTPAYRPEVMPFTMGGPRGLNVPVVVVGMPRWMAEVRADNLHILLHELAHASHFICLKPTPAGRVQSLFNTAQREYTETFAILLEKWAQCPRTLMYMGVPEKASREAAARAVEMARTNERAQKVTAYVDYVVHYRLGDCREDGVPELDAIPEAVLQTVAGAVTCPSTACVTHAYVIARRNAEVLFQTYFKGSTWPLNSAAGTLVRKTYMEPGKACEREMAVALEEQWAAMKSDRCFQK